MHVAGGHDRLVQVLAQLDDRAVEVHDLLDGIHLAVADHELVVAQGLDFQDVVVIGDLEQLVVALAGHDGPVKLARFTGGAEQQALPVLVQQAAGHTGLFEEILGVGGADDAVEVFQPDLVFDQDDQVVIFFLQHLFVAAQAGVDGRRRCGCPSRARSSSIFSKMRARAMASSTARWWLKGGISRCLLMVSSL